jgi:AraC-like DNA-binding protein
MNRDVQADSTVCDYREYPPPLPVAGHLLRLWEQTVVGSRDEFTQLVLPDGCIDIVAINEEAPFVVGPWTQAFVARFSPGTIIVGARFHPGVGPSLLGLPATALLNQSVALTDLWGGPASARFARVAGETNLQARKSAMEMALLHRLGNRETVDGAMSFAVKWLAQHPHGRIEQLSQAIGISSRQLQRRFAAAVGYGPKLFQSVLRFQRLLSLAGRASAPKNLAQFSAEVGYADQAHMTREVRRFSGSPPTALLPSARCALRLSNLLQETGDRDN